MLLLSHWIILGKNTFVIKIFAYAWRNIHKYLFILAMMAVYTCIDAYTTSDFFHYQVNLWLTVLFNFYEREDIISSFIGNWSDFYIWNHHHNKAVFV